MNATTNTPTALPTLPPRAPNARPWHWGADDARIAAQTDAHRATQDPRDEALEFAAAMRRAQAAS